MKFAQLNNAVSGARLECSGSAGRLSYYSAGQGKPLLLLHSINAAASAYEMRPIFESQRQSRCVYALDLPGFGFSERSRRRYEPELYVAATFDALDVIDPERRQRIDVVALSLSCEFLARAAMRQPERFGRLVFITPTGFQKNAENLRGAPGSTREVAAVSILLLALSDGLFGLLTSRSSIRYFLRRTAGSDNVDESLVDYAYRTAHQPGAKHAPLAFLSGALFSRDIRTVYENLKAPIWVPHGTRGDFADVSGASGLLMRENWRLQPFDAGALVHYEKPLEFMAGLERFLDGDSHAPG